MADPQARRILFVRLSALGDVINTLPTLDALRRGLPQAHIGYLVEDRAYDLIRNHPCLNQVHLYPRKRWVAMFKHPSQWWQALMEIRRFVAELRGAGYQVALNFQSNLKGALMCLLSGAPRRIGFSKGHSKEHSYWFNHENVTPPGGELINRVEKFLALASSIGADASGAQYRLPAAPESRSKVDAWLHQQGLQRFVAMHPGTSDFGAQKRWPPERFAAVAAQLGRTYQLPVVVTWGSGEQALAEQIAAGSQGQARIGMETRNVLDLAELIRRASLFIGCDSGPLHLASAVDAPSVALFGPKDPRTYAPWNPRSRVVQKGQFWGAMNDITVEDVMQAADSLLTAL
ncbi:MAG: glycosyltransferase family 9 protein [Nevskiales bacterium]